MRPRRLLLMLLGFLFCFGAYQVYSFFLGHFDGLPPLPMEYRPLASQSVSPRENNDERFNENKKHERAKLLERAFGPRCPELSRSRNIEIGKPESRTVFAFDEWTLEDGILRMTNVSLANFKKIAAEGSQPEKEEILTLQGDIAVIKFNQPVKNLFDLKPSVKPIAGHVEGEEIKLTHNHGTPDKQDDITVYCKKRIDFVDEQRRVWSDGKVLVVYAYPPEAKFEGIGLEIILANELVNKTADKNKSKQESHALGISTVKSIRLEKEVEFNFFKLQGGLLGNAPQATDKITPAANSTSQPMVIRCADAFTYDVQNHVAVFNTRVNALRHRSTVTPKGTTQQYDELDADEKLVLELMPPAKETKSPSNSLEEAGGQFELKKAVATGKNVRITANEDGKGNGLHAAGIEFVCDYVANEVRLRGQEQVTARMMEYDIVAQGIVKILLPEKDARDKDPRGLMIQGPGEIRLRPSTTNPDPYTLASWKRELQWHRLAEEHRIELYGDAVLTHDKHGRMAGEQVKAWLAADTNKKADENKAAQNQPLNTERLNGRLKRVEVDQRVSVFSTKLVIPQARRLTLNFTEAAEGTELPKPVDPFDTASAPGKTKPGLLGKPEGANPSPTRQPAPVLTLHAEEIDGDILVISDKQQVLRRLEARENVHIERKSDPGKQNGIDLRGQRLEMSLQGQSDQYRMKLFGTKATILTEKFELEGQQIDLDQAENRVTIPGPGKFKFYTDRDFQGGTLPKPEKVTFHWNEKMEFGGRAAQFVGDVLAEKGDREKGIITLSCYSMTIMLDKVISLSGKEEKGDGPMPGLESVVCIAKPSDTPGRLHSVLIEQRINPSPENPHRHIIRIEGVQVVFDNSRKDHEIIKVYGPGEVNLVRAGKNQLAGLGNPVANLSTGQANKPDDDALHMKLTRVTFQKEMEYRKNEGKLRFWENVKAFHVPGDDVGMPLDEKRLPKEGVYIASDKLEISAVQSQFNKNTTLHEMNAKGNTEMRPNQTSYVKADELTFSEEKGMVVMQGLAGNDALFYNQARPGASFQVQRARAFSYNMRTKELRGEDTKSFQFK
ncbi:MAG: hypothetical protein JNJ77_02910 [Planctomycetia bacterium]|nr:hypothetical protein [Planctomycetia bacterium]